MIHLELIPLICEHNLQVLLSHNPDLKLTGSKNTKLGTSSTELPGSLSPHHPESCHRASVHITFGGHIYEY